MLFLLYLSSWPPYLMLPHLYLSSWPPYLMLFLLYLSSWLPYIILPLLYLSFLIFILFTFFYLSSWPPYIILPLLYLSSWPPYLMLPLLYLSSWPPYFMLPLLYLNSWPPYLMLPLLYLNSWPPDFATSPLSQFLAIFGKTIFPCLLSFPFVTFFIHWHLSPAAFSDVEPVLFVLYLHMKYIVVGPSTYVYCDSSPYARSVVVSLHTTTLLITIQNARWIMSFIYTLTFFLLRGITFSPKYNLNGTSVDERITLTGSIGEINKKKKKKKKKEKKRRRN